MNFFVKLLCSVFLTVIVCSGETQDDILVNLIQLARDCVNKTGAEDSDMEVLATLIAPKSRKQECLLACFYKKVNIIDSDNKVSLESLKGTLSGYEKNPEKYKKYVTVFTNCTSQQSIETDECVAAKKFMDCTMKMAKEVGLLPK